MKRITITMFVCFFALMSNLFAQQSKEIALDYGYGLKDAPSISIGSQQWTAKNLNLKGFSNGDKIEQAQSNEEWLKAGMEKRPAWCYYENDPSKGQSYGILYNWFAVVDPRGLAPKGWHVPSKPEWQILIEVLGSGTVAGNKLKSSSLWLDQSGLNRNGSNESGFNALPAGVRLQPEGKFDALGIGCHFWTATQDDPEKGMAINIGSSSSVLVHVANMKFGYSVRCMKD